jgi:hypothetical protein
MANIKVKYVSAEDRIRIILEGNIDKSCWLTRSITLRLVSEWALKITEIGLPQTKIPQLNTERNLMQEHQISLEQRDVSKVRIGAENQVEVWRVEEIKLIVSKLDCQLFLTSQKDKLKIMFTRKEAHSFLDMIRSCVDAAKWRDPVEWPSWLE